MNLSFKTFVLAFCCAALPIMSQASESAVTDSVVDSCVTTISGERNTSALCEAYLAGFIEGAVLFDRLLVDHLYNDHDDTSGFFQRAYQTRVGMMHANLAVEEQPLFCLPESILLSDVVADVMGNISKPLLSRESLHTQILTYLQARFPCE